MSAVVDVENVTFMSLNQMIDLSLGIVHPGVIHFDLLGLVFRVLIQQLNLTDLRIQIKGKDISEMRLYSTSGTLNSRIIINTSTRHPSSGYQVPMETHSQRTAMDEEGDFLAAPDKESQKRNSVTEDKTTSLSDFPTSPKKGSNKLSTATEVKNASLSDMPTLPKKGSNKLSTATEDKTASLSDIVNVPKEASSKKISIAPEEKTASSSNIPTVPKEGSKRLSIETKSTSIPDIQTQSKEESQKQGTDDKSSVIDIQPLTNGDSRRHSTVSNVVVLENDSPKQLEHTVSMSVEQIQYLFDTVESLQNQINELKTMPNNQDLLEKIRRNSGSISRSRNQSIVDGSPQGTAARGSRVSQGSPVVSKTSVQTTKSDSPLVDTFQILTLTKRVDAVEEAMHKVASLLEDIAREGSGESGYTEPITSLSELRGKPITSMGNKRALTLLTTEIVNLKSLVLGRNEPLKTEPEKVLASTEGTHHHADSLSAKMTLVEVRIKQVMDQLEGLDRISSEEVAKLFKHFTEVSSKVDKLDESVSHSINNHKLALLSLNERCERIEKDGEGFSRVQKQVVDGEFLRKMQMSSLIEQVEVLKIRKADREDMEERLNMKLDADELDHKVSKERFESTYEEMKTHLDETISRLSTQEEMWQKALYEVQSEVVTKLEKNEMLGLQQFVKQKLKNLQEKIRTMKMYQQEQEAAATKQQLIKNMKCLSCDADADMRTKLTSADFPKAPELPPHKTMAPYLAYELDALRKQQKSLASSRNMHHFEAAVSKRGDRIENRYCGGPHTLTTPLQRVTRVGHFLEQWGPDVIAAGDKIVKGRDGNLYAATVAEKPPSDRRSKSSVSDIDDAQDKKTPKDFPEKDSSIHKNANRSKSKEMTQTLTGSPLPSVESSIEESNQRGGRLKKNIGTSDHQVRKVSAFSFDDNPEKFPYL